MNHALDMHLLLPFITFSDFIKNMSTYNESKEEESELSSLELRSKLFHSFRSKGVLQSVKVCYK